jgi:hypothetical protein
MVLQFDRCAILEVKNPLLREKMSGGKAADDFRRDTAQARRTEESVYFHLIFSENEGQPHSQ